MAARENESWQLLQVGSTAPLGQKTLPFKTVQLKLVCSIRRASDFQVSAGFSTGHEERSEFGSRSPDALATVYKHQQRPDFIVGFGNHQTGRIPHYHY